MTQWTEPEAVKIALSRRWARGELLGAYAAGVSWEPWSIRISGPSATDVTRELELVRAWVARWAKIAPAGAPVRVEQRAVGGRLSGRNDLPARAWIDGYTHAWRVLGVKREIAALDSLLDQTSDLRVEDWMRKHPMKVLAAAEKWSRIVTTAQWIEARQAPDSYLRHVDVPGVDTKFIEANRTAISALLDQLLTPDRIDHSMPASDLERRFGFALKPEYIRMRSLDPALRFGAFSEISVRTTELASMPPPGSRVLIVENEISYLAMPLMAGCIAIFGAGYGISRLRSQEWLAQRELLYWGDVDTHGLAILGQLRGQFGRVRSILMDRDTLLSHREHWTSEPKQHVGTVSHLNDDESGLLAELRSGLHGDHVRLEQERVRFALVERACLGD